MNYIIENNLLRVSVSSHGAELESIFCKANCKEYIWQGNPQIWSRRAPVLFPVIGRMKNGRYAHHGELYNIPIHGFAFTAEFELRRESNTEMTFMLDSNDETRRSYPFEFTLWVRYSLDGVSLRKEHLIYNRDQNEMLYEVGGHEGYCIDLESGGVLEDYHLDFGANLLQMHTTDDQLLMNRKTQPLLLQQGKMMLSSSSFEKDFIVLSGFDHRQVTLSNGDRSLSLDFDDFPYLGLWTKSTPKQTGYFCLEPWSSLPDGNYLGTELGEKEQVRHLAPNRTELLSYTISINL